LLQISPYVIGLDSSKEAIEIMKKAGYENVFLGNVENLKDFSSFSDVEIIIAGEIIEHLSNPGFFLDSIRQFCDGKNIKLVITTVNAYCLFRFVYFFTHIGKEYVHPDHLYYFSNSTLTSLLIKHGFKVTEIVYYNIDRRLRKSKGIPFYFWFLDIVSKKFLPSLSDGLIVIAEISK
jgi:2-polyprenyl-3-methyl-5-hydroxy-6-metoxy-1,4-benzoquinol methylase